MKLTLTATVIAISSVAFAGNIQQTKQPAPKFTPVKAAQTPVRNAPVKINQPSIKNTPIASTKTFTPVKQTIAPTKTNTVIKQTNTPTIKPQPTPKQNNTQYTQTRTNNFNPYGYERGNGRNCDNRRRHRDDDGNWAWRNRDWLVSLTCWLLTPTPYYVDPNPYPTYGQIITAQTSAVVAAQQMPVEQVAQQPQQQVQQEQQQSTPEAQPEKVINVDVPASDSTEVQVTNSDGSVTTVVLTKTPTGWFGQYCDFYASLPTSEQLKEKYGY